MADALRGEHPDEARIRKAAYCLADLANELACARGHIPGTVDIHLDIIRRAAPDGGETTTIIDTYTPRIVR